MPPAVSPVTMPPNRQTLDHSERSPAGSTKSRSSEKTEEEEAPGPSSARKKTGRPKARSKNTDEENAVSGPAHYQDFDEEDSDDELASGSKKNPKYYIVKNEKNGRPTEVFRTDRLHHLRQGAFNKEDSDDEYCGPNNGMLKLHDRWREEWNYGIQVPVNGQNLPVFETAENELQVEVREPFTLPVKYIGMTAETSTDSRHPLSPTRYVHPSTHHVVSNPDRLLYNADRLDEIYIEKVNRSRGHINHPNLIMRDFLRIMNALEVQCYRRLHAELLAPLNKNPEGVNDDDPCDICGSKEFDPGDPILYCDSCNECFHCSCYGLEKEPGKDETFNCVRCLLSADTVPPCFMCPTIGGALKPTEKIVDGKRLWCHVGCALWIPECRFEDPNARDNIVDIDRIPEERWQKRCVICDTKKGCCIQCSVPTCTTAFHVACATRAGYEMRIESNMDDPDSDIVHFIALCSRHRTAKTEECASNEQKANKLSSDEEVEERENVLLKNLEARFWMYIDEQQIGHQLKMDALNVSDVYEYWKLKRHNYGDKPLISNPQDEILNGNGYAHYNNGYSMIGNLRDRTTKTKHSWDNARSLCYMIQQREKLKKEKVELDLRIINNNWNQLLSQVPISERVTVQMVDWIKVTMSPESIAWAEEQEEEIMKGICSSSTSDSNEKVVPVKKRQSSPKRVHVVRTPKTEESRSLRGSPVKSQSPVKNSPLKRPVIPKRRRISSTETGKETQGESQAPRPKKIPFKRVQIKQEVISDEETDMTETPVERISVADSTESIWPSSRDGVTPSPVRKASSAKKASSRPGSSKINGLAIKKIQRSPDKSLQRKKSTESTSYAATFGRDKYGRRSGSRYRPLPDSQGDKPSPRKTRSFGPVQLIDLTMDDSPQAPPAKKIKLETPKKTKSVKQELMDVFNADAPLPPPPYSSPVSSRRRHGQSELISPVNRKRLVSYSDSEASEEIGEDGHLMRRAAKGSFDAHEAAPRPSLRRPSPLKESPSRQNVGRPTSFRHDSPSVSQRTRQRYSHPHTVFIEEKPCFF